MFVLVGGYQTDVNVLFCHAPLSFGVIFSSTIVKVCCSEPNSEPEDNLKQDTHK